MEMIEIPTQCPVCSSKLELIKDQLFCRNTLCEAQVGKKIEHFCKVLKIKGLGPATVAKLQLEDITQLFYLDEQELASQIGEKLSTKLLQEIEQSKESDFAIVLEAMSIPLVGKTASTKLASVINNFEELSNESCKLAGLGDKVTSNIMEWLITEYPEIKEFLPFKFEKKNKQAVPSTGKIVCITGKLHSFSKKSEAALALNAKGFQVSENFNKSVDFLVDEEDKNSTKRKQADKNGTSIITNLQEFLLNYNN
jgi:DNA ligase (NAD+)